MEYVFGYSGENKTTPLHKMNAKVKVVAILGFIAMTSTMTVPAMLLPAILFMLCLAGLARLSPYFLLKRLLWIVPFAGVMLIMFPFIISGETVWQLNTGLVVIDASREGVMHGTMLLLRVCSAVLAVIILTATTGFRELIIALGSLGLPKIFVQLIEFTMRYLHVVTGELKRLKLARQSRGFKTGKSLLCRHTFVTLGNQVGVLFIRSWERGERIYCAMLARGYSGDAGYRAASPVKMGDLCWGLGILAFALSLRLIELEGHLWQISLK